MTLILDFPVTLLNLFERLQFGLSTSFLSGELRIVSSNTFIALSNSSCVLDFWMKLREKKASVSEVRSKRADCNSSENGCDHCSSVAVSVRAGGAMHCGIMNAKYPRGSDAVKFGDNGFQHDVKLVI